jgi:hypothetical protein
VRAGFASEGMSHEFAAVLFEPIDKFNSRAEFIASNENENFVEILLRQ